LSTIAATPTAPALCSSSTDEVAYLEVRVPIDLIGAVQRHHENLVRMMNSLRRAGVIEDEVKRQIDVFVHSYRCELIEAASKLNKGPQYAR
jgi:hypothetical protein